jgi:peptidoglycan/LPS O-acetylase OafA/YrhL
MVLGCLAAMYLASQNRVQVRKFASIQILRNSIVGLTAITLLAVAVFYETGGSVRLERLNWIIKWMIPILALEFTLLISCLWYGERDWLSRCFSWSPLVYIGKISYGIYLYHMVAHYLTWNILLRDIENWNKFAKFGLRMALFLSLSITIAAISFHYFERHFLKLKSRLRGSEHRFINSPRVDDQATWHNEPLLALADGGTEQDT